MRLWFRRIRTTWRPRLHQRQVLRRQKLTGARENPPFPPRVIPGEEAVKP